MMFSMMTISPEPVSISIAAEKEFESLDEVIDVLKSVRSLTAVSDFENQLFDISGKESLVIFSEEVPESGGQNNIIFGPSSNLPPEDAENSDPTTLKIQSNFETGFDSMKGVFRELLEPESDILDKLTVLDVSFSFETESEFQSVEALKPLFEATDHTVTGIQFKQDGFIYIFQQTEDGIGINVNSEDNFTTEDHTFLDEKISQAKPFITEIIQGDD